MKSFGRFSNPMGALRYASQKGVKVGISSDRWPMIEIEHPEIMSCVHFLRNPRMVVFNKDVDESCKKVAEEIRRFVLSQFALTMQRGKWYHFLANVNGELKAPLILSVASKSLHFIGVLKFPRDLYVPLYMLYRTEAKYVDQMYIEYVIRKGYATLRLTNKKEGIKDFPIPLAIYEVAEVAPKKFMVHKIKCARWANVVVNRVLDLFQQLGMMAIWC